ncbi:hypothetical protein Dimus_028881, partial [Dionaea muscipula]
MQQLQVMCDDELQGRQTSALGRHEEEAKQTLLLSLCLNQKLKLGLLHGSSSRREGACR